MTFKSFLAASLIALAPLSVLADELKVAVAANFINTIETLAKNFEKQSGHTVKLTSGATGKFYTQIKNGAPFDIFFAADQKTPAKLEAEGDTKAGSRFTYAQGRLSMWIPNATAGTDAVDYLKQGNFKHLAIANPKAAPYGAAAEEVLTKLELLDALKPKMVMGENIGQTYQFVATGNAEAGFIPHSYTVDAKHVSKGSYWLVPQSFYTPLDQDVVIMNQAANNKVAQQFIDYIRSAEGKKIIESNGYSVP